MENLRTRVSVKLINNAKDYVKCISKPIFVSQKIFSKNFVAIHQVKFSILDLSKLLMYKFHYEYVKKN